MVWAVQQTGPSGEASGEYDVVGVAKPISEARSWTSLGGQTAQLKAQKHCSDKSSQENKTKGKGWLAFWARYVFLSSNIINFGFCFSFQFKSKKFSGGFGLGIGTASGSFVGSGINGGGCVWATQIHLRFYFRFPISGTTRSRLSLSFSYYSYLFKLSDCIDGFTDIR